MPSIIGEQKLFPTISSIDEIATDDFLEAAMGAVAVVGSMGSQFSMTKDDMLGNIKKVRTKYATDKTGLHLLKALLQNEKTNKEDKNDKSGTVGALWLKRGLEYLCELFWELIQEHIASKQPGAKSDSGAVKAACKKSYEKTLTKYHNMASRMVVKGGLMLSPYKETVMTNLAHGEKGKDDQVIEDMKAYEKPLRAYIILVCQLFQSLEYKDECIAAQP